jgi:ABC-2 type transport system ATP-binding protein
MLLSIEHVTKRYRGGVVANDDVSLDVGAGEVFGLLGPNGAGKTTLVAQVLGLAEPTLGRIRIDGVDVVARPNIARESCSYQPQGSVPIDGLTPTQAIEFAGRIRGGSKTDVRDRAAELLARLDLGEWERKATTLSGGVARLIAFCMAAVVPGRIVILDEPTNDIDPLRRKYLWQLVRELADGGAAVLLVTHNVLEAERCVDRLAILDVGRVVATGTPASLRAVFGEGLRLELVLEPGAEQPGVPSFIERPAVVGHRFIGEIARDDVGEAVAWATQLQHAGTAQEYFLGPATLEDVYVRHVASRETESVA